VVAAGVRQADRQGCYGQCVSRQLLATCELMLMRRVTVCVRVCV
jgi:hypothetical protein